MSKLRRMAKEKGWTDPYALMFPPVFATVMLISFLWRDGFDGSAQSLGGRINHVATRCRSHLVLHCMHAEKWVTCSWSKNNLYLVGLLVKPGRKPSPRPEAGFVGT